MLRHLGRPQGVPPRVSKPKSAAQLGLVKGHSMWESSDVMNYSETRPCDRDTHIVILE